MVKTLTYAYTVSVYHGEVNFLLLRINEDEAKVQPSAHHSCFRYMGHSASSVKLSPNVVDASVLNTGEVFKVDNINFQGRKHASARIQISNDSLCIEQKHRQSLHIPLEAIKRYGLDGSMFILECGRRAPLGQARYAFRCKQAHRLVSSLDQRIAAMSKLLSEQQGALASFSSTIPNASSHRRRRRPRRTQSDQGLSRQTPSSMLFSSLSSSSISWHSKATLSYRNSEPNLAENYLPLSQIPSRSDRDRAEERLFLARLKQDGERQLPSELNYVHVKAESIPTSVNEKGSRLSSPSSLDIDLIPIRRSDTRIRRSAYQSAATHSEPSQEREGVRRRLEHRFTVMLHENTLRLSRPREDDDAQRHHRGTTAAAPSSSRLVVPPSLVILKSV